MLKLSMPPCATRSFSKKKEKENRVLSGFYGKLSLLAEQELIIFSLLPKSSRAFAVIFVPDFPSRKSAGFAGIFG